MIQTGKKPALIEHIVHCEKMEKDELQYFVIHLKGMVGSRWWCGDQEFSVTPEGMVNVIQREQAMMCLVL